MVTIENSNSDLCYFFFTTFVLHTSFMFYERPDKLIFIPITIRWTQCENPTLGQKTFTMNNSVKKFEPHTHTHTQTSAVLFYGRNTSKTICILRTWNFYIHTYTTNMHKDVSFTHTRSSLLHTAHYQTGIKSKQLLTSNWTNYTTSILIQLTNDWVNIFV